MYSLSVWSGMRLPAPALGGGGGAALAGGAAARLTTATADGALYAENYTFNLYSCRKTTISMYIIFNAARTNNPVTLK